MKELQFAAAKLRARLAMRRTLRTMVSVMFASVRESSAVIAQQALVTAMRSSRQPVIIARVG